MTLGRPASSFSFCPPRAALVAGALLAAAAATNAYTFRSLRRESSVVPPPDATLLAEPKEIAARRSELAGTYATGDRPGDRLIILGADGQATFSELGRTVPPNADALPFHLGRRQGKLIVVIADGSMIQVTNLETLVYFRDTYRRRR